MKKFIVISHTHWDREWYLSYSAFRLKLVDLIDRLLLIIEKDPEYIFHLDAQTIVLEDYLELRPGNEGKLKACITAGNICVGPWYLQNDFYLTDGESTVRNLMFGTKQAAAFGRCSKVGYAPDQFGNISQLPQILNNFGIDSFIFGRGYRAYEITDGKRVEKPLPTEFEWRGEDGSRCLAVYLRSWYNNAQHIPAEDELANLLLDINEKNFEGRNVSPYVLLMNGVDHLEAQADVREIVARLKRSGRDIEQCSLDEYIEKVKKSISSTKLDVHTGALNRGGDYELLKGCWSSRIYLKQRNVNMQDLLENKIEPLYSHLLTSGFDGVYPADELRYLWKKLLKNHPHDSICGCSIDSVHQNMENNFSRIEELGTELCHRGMRILAAHSRHLLADDKKNYSITVFNGTERVQSGATEVTVNFLKDDKVCDFAIVDADGNELAYEKLCSQSGHIDVFSPLNLPGVLDVEKVKIRFLAKDIPAYAANIYAVVPGRKGKLQTGEPAGDAIENEYYRIDTANNVLTITDKRTCLTLTDPVILEDSADKGDSYVYRKSPHAPLTVSPYAFKKPEIGQYSQSVAACYRYDCPAQYHFASDCRSAETVPGEAIVTLTLEKESSVIGLTYTYNNHACDHRVRLLLHSGVKEGRLFTDTPFDCAERIPGESCDETDSDTHCCTSFADLRGEGESFCVYTEGQHEVQRSADGLVFTILRSTGYINRNMQTFEPVGGPCWEVRENQVLREISGRLGLYYGKTRSAAVVYAAAKFFRNGFMCTADSFDPVKYVGGRFAVQATELARLYYVKDRFEGKLAAQNTFVSYESEEIAVTCFKAGEAGGAVMRFVNLSPDAVQATFSFSGKAYVTNMSEQSETNAAEHRLTLSFAPKQIITLRFDKLV